MPPSTLSRVRKITLITGVICSVIVLSLGAYSAYLSTCKQANALLKGQLIAIDHATENFINIANKALIHVKDDLNRCDEKGHEALKKIVLNVPEISIAYLKTDKTQCASINSFQFSAIPTISLKSEKNNNNFKLFGPLIVSDIFENAYVLMTAYRNNQLGLVFPKQILNEFILNKIDPAIQVAFTDKNDKTLYSHPVSANEADDYFQSRQSLKGLNNIYVTVYVKKSWVWHKLAPPHLLISIVLALLLCIALLFFIYKITQHKLSLATAIKNGIKADQFIPHYEMIKSLKTNKTRGVECLMRWQLDESEVVYPDFFIPTAERTGLIKPMTTQLIKQVFKDLGEYTHANPEFHIGLNLSPYHFHDKDCLHLVTQLCQTYQIKHQQILFEITEQELIEEDNDYAVSIMKEMRTAGFNLAIDDFGTGYSSIDYLRRFPFNYLKVDKQFVMAIGSEAITAQLIDSIIDLAHNLDLLIIAEGIETQKQEDYLKQRLVDFGQGWLYSKALPADSIIQELNAM